MEKIVVGVDGSQHGARALRWAVGYAATIGGRVIAVQAWSISAFAYGGLGFGAIDLREYEHAARESLQRTVADQAGGVPDGVEIEQRVLEGGTAAVLLDLARDESADLLVVGSRGHGGFAGLLLGSVSATLAHHTPCPLAIVPAAWREEPGARRETGAVVVGVDGSRGAAEALHWVLSRAERLDRRVIAVSAWEPPLDPFGVVKLIVDLGEFATRELAESVAAETDSAGVDVQQLTMEGTAASVLLYVAEQEHADMVVVGTRGRGGFAGLLLGSTSSTLAHHAPSPLVIVPSQRRGAGGDG
jgi:nucleotide-binding universal stress UspA family protein